MNTFYETKRSAAAAAAALLTGTAAGAALSAVLMCLCAAVFVKAGSVPSSGAPVIAAAIGAVGAFFAGYFTVKLCGSRGLLMGGLAGLLMFCAVLIGSAASHGISSVGSAAVRALIYAVCGSVGGVVRVNKRVKVRSAR